LEQKFLFVVSLSYPHINFTVFSLHHITVQEDAKTTTTCIAYADIQ